jgi:hypothetical protein
MDSPVLDHRRGCHWHPDRLVLCRGRRADHLLSQAMVRAMSQTSPVSESALSVLIKQYALDLRRNPSGGDDYPYEFAKGVADYLGVLIKRAKGDCTCAQAGFPDSCDNCDSFASAQCPPQQIAAPGNDQLSNLWNAIVENTKGDGFWIGEILLTTLEREVGFNPAALADSSPACEGK